MPLTVKFLDELRDRTVLSSVVGPTVKLIRAGSEWKGLCPFHQEKTPSFTVNDEKGFYHCFGCGAHGDAIRFLTDSRGMPFMEAVKELASKAGMKIPSNASKIDPETEAPLKPRRSQTGGAKLGRSETVTVRLDPKLNYLCELAARAQRRTKSSFIEWAIANSLGSVSLPDVRILGENFGEVREATLADKTSQLWHVDEPDRVAALALIAPALLTHEEQLVWRHVRENGFLWKGSYNKEGEWTWEVKEKSLIRDRLRDHWETFKAVALEEVSKDELPTWQKRKSTAGAFDADLDDDVPF